LFSNIHREALLAALPPADSIPDVNVQVVVWATVLCNNESMLRALMQRINIAFDFAPLKAFVQKNSILPRLLALVDDANRFEEVIVDEDFLEESLKDDIVTPSDLIIYAHRRSIVKPADYYRRLLERKPETRPVSALSRMLSVPSLFKAVRPLLKLSRDDRHRLEREFHRRQAKSRDVFRGISPWSVRNWLYSWWIKLKHRNQPESKDGLRPDVMEWLPDTTQVRDSDKDVFDEDVWALPLSSIFCTKSMDWDVSIKYMHQRFMDENLFDRSSQLVNQLQELWDRIHRKVFANLQNDVHLLGGPALLKDQEEKRNGVVSANQFFGSFWEALPENVKNTLRHMKPRQASNAAARFHEMNTDTAFRPVGRGVKLGHDIDEGRFIEG
jgi:hypothetical protein